MVSEIKMLTYYIVGISGADWKENVNNYDALATLAIENMDTQLT